MKKDILISYYSAIFMIILLHVVLELAHARVVVTNNDHMKNGEFKSKQIYKKQRTDIKYLKKLEYMMQNANHMRHLDANKSENLQTFETYDAAELKLRNFVSPNVVKLSRLTAERDKFLASNILKQYAMYSPITASSSILENNLQYVVDEKNHVAEEHLLPVQEFLEGIKFNIESTTNARNIVAPGIAICILNPQCCISPVSCAPS